MTQQYLYSFIASPPIWGGKSGSLNEKACGSPGLIICAAAPEVMENMSDEREEGRTRGGQMFIEREHMIDSILGLLWPNAFAEPEPLSPGGENEWKDERRRRWCVCVCLCVKPTSLLWCLYKVITNRKNKSNYYFVVFEFMQ